MRRISENVPRFIFLLFRLFFFKDILGLTAGTFTRISNQGALQRCMALALARGFTWLEECDRVLFNTFLARQSARHSIKGLAFYTNYTFHAARGGSHEEVGRSYEGAEGSATEEPKNRSCFFYVICDDVPLEMK